mmetsp:Transcript_29558/g.72023  ORF Transcript_29558/g.72023 Transcript_29558/m.72023 type:complete len:186 (-) Transcript_29558:224-781(-)
MSDAVKGADSTEEYTPVVSGLKEVDLSEEQKKITNVYEHRCLIYFFSKEKNQWITRGKGNVRIQKHQDSPYYQMVLYEEKTFKLRLCCIVPPETPLAANEGSDRLWTFACMDFSESEDGKGQPQSVAIKFKNAEIAEKFKAEYEKYQSQNKAAMESKGSATQAVSKKEEPKKEEEKKEENKKETA